MYNSLQPLMICLSYNGTMKQMKSLIKDFDAPVFEWSKDLANNLKVGKYHVAEFRSFI